MTAKEYVKQKYPNAYAKKVTQRGPFGKSYWLIYPDYNSQMYIADGDYGKPESSAWVKAKKEIQERLTS